MQQKEFEEVSQRDISVFASGKRETMTGGIAKLETINNFGIRARQILNGKLGAGIQKKARPTLKRAPKRQIIRIFILCTDRTGKALQLGIRDHRPMRRHT